MKEIIAMLFGHNSNVKVGETTFHVQTEDRGVTTALIDTTVYYVGRVMHRRTNNYHDLVPLDADREEALRLRLDEQHRSTLEDIRSGALYLAAPPSSARPARAANAAVEQVPENNSARAGTPGGIPAATSAAKGGPAAANLAPPVAHATSVHSTNGSSANDGASQGASAAIGAGEIGNPIPSSLKLELRNARTWLSGKQASLEIAIASASGEPLSGVKVLAYIEGASTAEQYAGETDASGHAQITFAMPRLSGTPAALVIEAWRAPGEPTSRATMHGKLRFALRTKPRPA
jgi:hypothetical protein